MSAMHPLDELKTIEAELHAEADHLAQLLGNGKLPDLSPLAKSLAAKIAAASGSDGLQQYEMLLEKRSGLGLPADDCSYLQGLLSERYDQMLAIHGNDRNPPIIPLTPALRFRQTLAQDKPVTLVCDGHNIINTMEQFEKVRNRDHAEARQLLVETVITQLQPYPHVAATIVYDGPDHDRVQVSNNVTVIYSGGGSRAAKHRADKRIEELLNWRTFAGESTPVFLVTDDYHLGQEAQQNRAVVIPLEQFGHFLP
jgi:predicted RNA-binding protein with PIN domain